MRIKSNYYDVIDYLQDFSDERIWMRVESTVWAKCEDMSKDPIEWKFMKDHTNRPYPYQINSDLFHTKNVYENANLYENEEDELKTKISIMENSEKIYKLLKENDYVLNFLLHPGMARI